MNKKSTGLNSLLKADSPNQSRMGLTEDDLSASINFFGKRVEDPHNENSKPAINSISQTRELAKIDQKNFFDYLKFDYDKEKLLIKNKTIEKTEKTIENKLSKGFNDMKKISSRTKVAQTAFALSPADLDKIYNQAIDIALSQVTPKISETKGATHIPTNIGPLKGGGETWKWITSDEKNDNIKKISYRDKGALKKFALAPLVDIANSPTGFIDNYTTQNLRAMFQYDKTAFFNQYTKLNAAQKDIINNILGIKGSGVTLRPPAPRPALPNQTAPTTSVAPPAPGAPPAPPSVAPPAGSPPTTYPSGPGTQLKLPFGSNPPAPGAPPSASISGSAPPVSVPPRPGIPVNSSAPGSPFGPPSGPNPPPSFYEPTKTWGTRTPKLPAVRTPSLLPEAPKANYPYSAWPRQQTTELALIDKVKRPPPGGTPSGLGRFMPKSSIGRGAGYFLAALVADEVLNQSAAITYGKDLAEIFKKEFRRMLDSFVVKYNSGQSFGNWTYNKIVGGMSPKDAIDTWFRELNNKGVRDVFSGSSTNPFAEKLRTWGKGLWNIVSLGSGSEWLTALNSEALLYANEAVGIMNNYVGGQVSGGRVISFVPPVSGGASASGGAGSAMTTPPASSSSGGWSGYDNSSRMNGAPMVGSISEVHHLWNTKQADIGMSGYRPDPSFRSFRTWYLTQFPPGSGTGGVLDTLALLRSL